MLRFKVDEAVRVGGARILVSEIRGGRVLLGIDAPRETAILRDSAVHRAPPLAARRKARRPR